MAVVNRRVGIVGLILGALACLLCGLPVIATFVGVSGLTLSAISFNLATVPALVISAVSIVLLFLIVTYVSRKQSRAIVDKKQ